MGLKVAISVMFLPQLSLLLNTKRNTRCTFILVKVRGNISIYKLVESIGHVVYGMATDGKRSIDVVTVNHNS